jgi:hypothetical protein
MAKRGKIKGPARVLESRPVLRNSLVSVWEAFQRLGTCRPSSMNGLTPIPWTAIDHYAIRFRFIGYDYDRLLHFITVLDSVYLQWQPNSGSGGGTRNKTGK